MRAVLAIENGAEVRILLGHQRRANRRAWRGEAFRNRCPRREVRKGIHAGNEVGGRGDEGGEDD